MGDGAPRMGGARCDTSGTDRAPRADADNDAGSSVAESVAAGLPGPALHCIGEEEDEAAAEAGKIASTKRPADLVDTHSLRGGPKAKQDLAPQLANRASESCGHDAVSMSSPDDRIRSRQRSVLIQPEAMKRLSVMHSLALDGGSAIEGDSASDGSASMHSQTMASGSLPETKPGPASPDAASGTAPAGSDAVTRKLVEPAGHFRFSQKGEDVRTLLQRQRMRARCFVIKPDAPFRITWDVVSLILLVYIALITPVRIGFELDTTPGSMLYVWEQFIDAFFLTDVVLNFRTGYLRKDASVEMRPPKIARNYLKSFFVIDVVSSVPIDLFVQSMENLQSAKVLKAGKILRVGRILKLAKLTRLMKLPYLLGRFEEDFSFGVVRLKLMRILLTTSLIAHLDACGWALISRVEGSYYSDSWVKAYGVQDDSIGSQYVSALYWAITTMTTVGYGDIAPETDAERLYCLVTMIFGGGFYAYVIATLSSIVTNQDANQRMVSERMENLQAYMRVRKFPKHLARRVRKYYKHYYEMKTALNESTILEDLSPALRAEVVLFLVDQTVMQNPLFQQMSPKSFARLIRILFPLKVEEGEWICHEGEYGEEMYMLVSGKLEVVGADGSVQAVLSSGAHFGELCALGVTSTRTCGVRALECCELYALSKTDFYEVFGESEPGTIKNMISVAVSAYNDLDLHRPDAHDAKELLRESARELHGSAKRPRDGSGPLRPQASAKSVTSAAGTWANTNSTTSLFSNAGNQKSSSSAMRSGLGVGAGDADAKLRARVDALEASSAAQLADFAQSLGRIEDLIRGQQDHAPPPSLRRDSRFDESVEQRYARLGVRTSTDPHFKARSVVTCDGSAGMQAAEDSPTFEHIVRRNRRRSQAANGTTGGGGFLSSAVARRRSTAVRIRPLPATD